MDELQAQLDADVAGPGLEAGDGPLWTGTLEGRGGVTVSFFGPAWGLQNHAQCEELSASGGKRKGSSGGSGFALRRLARRPTLSPGASASHRSLFLQVLVRLLSQRGASLTRLPRTLATLYHATTAKLTLYPGYRRSILLEVVTRYEMY